MTCLFLPCRIGGCSYPRTSITSLSEVWRGGTCVWACVRGDVWACEDVCVGGGMCVRGRVCVYMGTCVCVCEGGGTCMCVCVCV